MSFPAIRGSGVAQTENRIIGDFTSLEIDIPAELEITKGDQPSLELSMDDNLMSHVTTVVENGTLRITSEETLSFSSPPKVVINVPSLSSVSIAGSSKGSIQELSGEMAQLSIAGSADITVGLQSEKFDLEIAGSGSVTATGNCNHIDVSIAGSGTVHTESVAANTAAVSISGSGDVFVHAQESLNVSVAGSGDIKYSGDPKIGKSIVGHGSVTKMN